MKWLWLLVVLALVGGSWYLFAKSGERIGLLEARIENLLETGDSDSQIPGLQGEIQSLEGTRTFNGILMAIATAAFLGTLFVVVVLPAWASRVSEGVYGSTAEVDEPAAFHEARTLIAKGDYEGAIAAFRAAAAEDPSNRLPWTEIARIQARQLDEPAEAAATLQQALSAWDWPADDRAFLLFRLAEIQNEEMDGRGQAVATLQQVIREFPQSRHAMNAGHRLKEWQ